MEPTRLSHYDITGKIGAGGMGEVYRARDSKLGRDVALKLLPDAFARDPERLSRFEREARLLASLNHPRIGAIYGLDESSGVRFLVLELVEGEDLARRLQRGAIPVEDALTIAEQVCEALEAAHEAGVIHRDLKPSNIIVSPNGAVKVLDFGLAKAFDPASNASNLTQSPTLLGSSPTMQGVILGTAAYMSPEQARGRVVDKRADIFAFGCVLYEMLAGRQAFSGETVSDTLAAVLRADADSAALPKDTPEAIRRLLKRCLEKDPKRRLRDIGEAGLIIGDVRTGRVMDGPASTGAPSIPKQRFLTPRVIVVAAVLLAAVGVGASALTRMLAPKAPEPPLRKFLVSTAEDTLGSITNPSISPDGSRVAYHCAGRLWIRDLDRLASRNVGESSNEVTPFWSPDGAYVGFVTSKRLWKVPAGGGEPLPLCDSPGTFGGGAGASWGTDGRIVFATGSSGLYEVSESGGDWKELMAADPSQEQDVHTPATLPGGKGVLFVQHRNRSGPDTIQLLADGVRHNVLTLEHQNLWSLAYASSGYILFARIPENSGLWAVRYSLETHETVGEPFLVAAYASEGSTSRNGMLAYQPSISGESARLAWFDENGEFVSYAGDAIMNVNSMALSPDGNLLAASLRDGSSRDVWVIDLTRKTKTKLTFSGQYSAQPAWSPDGKAIAYRDYDEDGIYVQASDGTGERRFAAKGSFPCFCPDGNTLTFCAPEEGQKDMDIFTIALNATDAKPQALIRAPGMQRFPSVSPDGRYIAYSSNESGIEQVYLSTFPKPTGKWQVSVSDGATWPRWSPKSDRIYFRTEEGVQMVSVEGSSVPRLGTPRDVIVATKAHMELWGLDKLAIGPDGSRVLIVQTAINASEENGIVVVENWLQEFVNR